MLPKLLELGKNNDPAGKNEHYEKETKEDRRRFDNSASLIQMGKKSSKARKEREKERKKRKIKSMRMQNGRERRAEGKVK